jgi:serine/threonine protein kinase
MSDSPTPIYNATFVRVRCVRCNTTIATGLSRCAQCGMEVVVSGNLEVITLARPPGPYAAGDLIADQYEVIESYGTGPLGTTYRARDGEGKAVAVKVVSQELLSTSEERDAFVATFAQWKGRTMTRVAMPLDAGIDAGGVVFVVSPWVFGSSLRRILRAWRAAERRLETDQVLGVLQGVAAALRELHTLSSHGALYPESVQITATSVVLTDPLFAGGFPPKIFAAHANQFPEILPYLSPEVLAGKRPNAGSDLYGLGALASELLFNDASATALPKVKLPETPVEFEESLRALVSDQPSKRASALPQCLERLSRIAGGASLPFAVLPRPTPGSEARTRRVRSLAVLPPSTVFPKKT